MKLTLLFSTPISAELDFSLNSCARIKTKRFEKFRFGDFRNASPFVGFLPKIYAVRTSAPLLRTLTARERDFEFRALFV